MRRLWILVTLLLVGCATVPPRPPVGPDPYRAIAVVVQRPDGQPVEGATVLLDQRPTPYAGTTNADGYHVWPRVEASLTASHLTVTAPGFEPYSQHVDLVPGNQDLRVTLGPVRPIFMGRILVTGRHLAYVDGTPFVWRGVTAFLLTEQIARGQRDAAEAFITWATRAGFNVLRILVMLPGGWTDGHALSPAEGLRALPDTLSLIKAHGIYAHVTVLANTANLPDHDLGSYVAEAGAVCAVLENCALLEVANEPYHGTQRSDVHEVANLERWARRVPASVPVALGPAPDDEARTHTGGTVITVHLDRGRDPWNMVRRVRELELLSADTGKPVLNSEPMGFAEVERPGARVTDPDLAFAFGLLGRIFNVGTTLHLEDGLRALVPGPRQNAATEAFLEGSRLVPDTVRPSFSNARWPGAPVIEARFAEGPPKDNATVRAYTGTWDSRGLTMLLGVRGDPGLVVGNGWRVTGTAADRASVRVLTISR